MNGEHDLATVRTDGWFAELLQEAPQLARVAEAIGERTLAFLTVAGLQIASVDPDPDFPDMTTVELRTGAGDETTTLPLGELRRQLSVALSDPEPRAMTLPEAPTPDDLRAYIGARLLLLAPLYGVRFESLRIDANARPFARVTVGAANDHVPLDELRRLIEQRVRGEGGAPAQPFSIDLELVPAAAAAVADEDWPRAVRLLEAWPGPLSMLLRTAEGRDLGAEVKVTLAQALGFLAQGYAALGKTDLAEEVLRLGIQWGQEESGPVSAELFRILGAVSLGGERPGQAIGLFRRALGLGAPEPIVLPDLARAYAGAGHALPALLCVRRAAAAGTGGGLDDVEAKAREALGDPWERFERFLAEEA
ncbi:MAG: hypothetical protein AAGH15_10930 [Myxococcota bacterium]